jgi:translation initiation factor 3 subunit M
LRPTTLLALLSVLALSSDLPALSLSSSSLATSLNQWAIPTSEKIAFLVEAADIYQSASLLSKSLELSLLALNIEVSEQVAEKAVVLTLADESKFDLSQVLKTQGVTAKISGKAAELVRLFTEADELEAVSQGQQWAEANVSYISGFSRSLLLSPWPVADNIDIPKFTPESIGRKLRLIALTTLCSRSTSKQISYAEISSALSIPDADVEAWVIDGKTLFSSRITPQADVYIAIRADLLKARLSQPASLVKIQSVSAAGTRRFGDNEWQTLERRLQEWKKSVSEARSVIAEAEAVAAQGPITHQRRDGQRQGQGQQQRQEEVTA